VVVDDCKCLLASHSVCLIENSSSIDRVKNISYIVCKTLLLYGFVRISFY
jgi:hypothetical protein